MFLHVFADRYKGEGREEAKNEWDYFESRDKFLLLNHNIIHQFTGAKSPRESTTTNGSLEMSTFW